MLPDAKVSKWGIEDNQSSDDEEDPLSILNVQHSKFPGSNIRHFSTKFSNLIVLGPLIHDIFLL